MNARQTKKRLKKQIDRLKFDNDLMQRIIADSPKMQELYDVYTRSLSATYATLPFQEFKARRMISADMAGVEGTIERMKQILAEDLFESIKENIIYEIDAEDRSTTVTASIFIGRG